MKNFYLILALICLSHLSYSQMRLGILGGPHSAAVKEQNTLPSWETQVKPNYSARPGLNLGLLADIPLSAKSNRWYLSPGLFYMSKGRKYYMRNETLTSIQTDTISSSHNLAVNYIDMPFNLTYKLPLGKKAKFILSAGPYIGFFYSGKQTFETRMFSSNSFKSDEINLETGDEEGKMKTFNAGWNARAGFEIGSLILTGFMSEGLTDFYTAPYEGSFRHQVRGISVGFWLNKVKQNVVAKTDKDTDKDGVPDKNDKCPAFAGPAITGGCPDKDSDGVADAGDRCPEISGLAKLAGCPDKDADGIADRDDKCPEISGLIKYEGCPVPDTDSDGVNDEDDACPAIAGIADFKGCPVPDTDGDGQNDRDDKCPTVAGIKENNGCPEIKKEIRRKLEIAAKNIFFRASSDQLTLNSFGALDDVARELKANPTYHLVIEGHTDSTGSAALNSMLSQARADAVKRYLLQQGIEENRLKASGFGPAQPLVSNETLEGRRKNRRVELKLVQ